MSSENKHISNVNSLEKLQKVILK